MSRQIQPEEFALRFAEYSRGNYVLTWIAKRGLGFRDLPHRLKLDALARMGLEERRDPNSDMVAYFEIES